MKRAVLFGLLLTFAAPVASAQQISAKDITILIDSGVSLSAGADIRLNGECRGLVPLHSLHGARTIKATKGVLSTQATLEWPLEPTEEDKRFDLAVVKFESPLGKCLAFEDIKDDERLAAPADSSVWVAKFYGYQGTPVAAEFSRKFEGERHLRAGVYYWRMPEIFERGSSGAPVVLAGQMIGVVWGTDTVEKFGYVLTNTAIKSRLGRNYPVATTATREQ